MAGITAMIILLIRFAIQNLSLFLSIFISEIFKTSILNRFLTYEITVLICICVFLIHEVIL